MRATLIYGAGDVRVEEMPDPVPREPTDAIVRVARSCICGRELWPYGSRPATTRPSNATCANRTATPAPAIVDPPASLDGYGTVLLGSPIWNARPPMIMSTFTEAYDFTGTTVLPLVTYAVSGLGRTVEIYTASCRGATFGEALAVRGEEIPDSRATVDAWLRRVGPTR
jgi:hypothetical protein